MPVNSFKKKFPWSLPELSSQAGLRKDEASDGADLVRVNSEGELPKQEGELRGGGGTCIWQAASADPSTTYSAEPSCELGKE